MLLWLRFAAYAFRASLAGRSPLTVQRTELLGREIFSRTIFSSKTGKVKPNAFQAYEISVNRLSLMRRQAARDLAVRHAKQRNRTFYGFAEIGASEVVDLALMLRGDPVRDNPFHANIGIPADIERDAMLLYAVRLSERAKFSSP